MTRWGRMAQHFYNVHLQDGTVHEVTTPHHHDDHDDKTFKAHRLDVIKGASEASSPAPSSTSCFAGGDEQARRQARGAAGTRRAHQPVCGPGRRSADPAETAARRQEILNDMLTSEYVPGWIAGMRRYCATGGAPASVAEARTEGEYFTPDAADRCVIALVRTANDHRLPKLYSKLLAELGGSADRAEKLPRAIGTTVLNGTTKVAIGNSKVITMSPVLALDAGFTVAYRDGSASKAGNADAKQLRALAGTCVAQWQDAGTCFSVGYAYGGRAFKAQSASAR